MDPYAWTADLDALVLCPALLAGYALAVRRYPTDRARAACFLGGVVLLAAVFVTPLGNLALHYLLWAHLLQNVALAEWAPALLVLGLPPALARAAERLPGARTFTNPAVALPLWLGTYFAWHLPWPYDAALRNHALLHLEHACYFASGVLFWWPVVHGRHGNGLKAVYVFAAFVLAAPLGLLLALLPNPIYDFYEDAPRLMGLSPLSDQQIAGVTMAVEQAVVLFGVFATFLLRFLAEEEGEGTYRTLSRSRVTSGSRGRDPGPRAPG